MNAPKQYTIFHGRTTRHAVRECGYSWNKETVCGLGILTSGLLSDQVYDTANPIDPNITCRNCLGVHKHLGRWP